MVRCTMHRTGAALISWRAPEQLGQPELHKYVVEKLNSTGQWELITESDDGHQVTVPSTEQGSQYRVTAWNIMGRSLPSIAACHHHKRRGQNHEEMPQIHGRWSWESFNSIIVLLLPLLMRLVPLPVLQRLAVSLRLVVQRVLPTAGAARPLVAPATAAVSTPYAEITAVYEITPDRAAKDRSLGTSSRDGLFDSAGIGTAGFVVDAARPPLHPGYLAERASASWALSPSLQPPVAGSMIKSNSHGSLQDAKHPGGSSGAWGSGGFGGSRAGEMGYVAHAGPGSPGTGGQWEAIHHSVSTSAMAAAVTPDSPTSKVCAYPGCNTCLSRWKNYKEHKTKHYCGRCQRTYCLQHTEYSPHGNTGTCGQNSNCVCVDCFKLFTLEFQMQLMQRNKLCKANSRTASGDRPSLQRTGSTCSARAPDGVSPASSQELMKFDSGRSGKQLWTKAATKMKAVWKISHVADHKKNE